MAKVSVLQDHAKKNNRSHLLDALLQSKTTESTPSTLSGFSALHLAVFFGHTEIVKALLDAGAKLGHTELGISVLELAEVMDDDCIVKLIKDKIDSSKVGAYKNDINLMFFSFKETDILTPPSNDLSLHKQRNALL